VQAATTAAAAAAALATGVQEMPVAQDGDCVAPRRPKRRRDAFS